MDLPNPFGSVYQFINQDRLFTILTNDGPLTDGEYKLYYHIPYINRWVEILSKTYDNDELKEHVYTDLTSEIEKPHFIYNQLLSKIYRTHIYHLTEAAKKIFMDRDDTYGYQSQKIDKINHIYQSFIGTDEAKAEAIHSIVWMMDSENRIKLFKELEKTQSREEIFNFVYLPENIPMI
jgi:hypothetical protein